MSDDFGTVNVRRGDRAREIEAVRQRYRAHRDALARMLADAPSEQLAGDYERLIQTIDAAMLKLDELEGQPTEAGTRPLITPPPPARERPPDVGVYEPPEAPPSGASRMAMILVAGLVVLGILGWLIWRASSDRTKRPAIEQPTASATATQPVSDTAAVDTGGTVEPIAPVASPPVTPAPASAALRIVPALQDYGTVRKGTRASRQFEITNMADQPIRIKVARSQCRCLFYEYSERLEPKKKETITVTVDGARAKAGDLRESLAVTSPTDPALKASLEVSATVQ